jgi:hypothetical protein
VMSRHTEQPREVISSIRGPMTGTPLADASSPDRLICDVRRIADGTRHGVLHPQTAVQVLNAWPRPLCHRLPSRSVSGSASPSRASWPR